MYTSFKEYLAEALPMSMAREYTRISNNYKTLYKDIFDDKDRRYFDFKHKPPRESNTQAEIEEFLFGKGYEIESYSDNIAKTIDDNKQRYKIGKLLQKFGRMDLVKQYSLDPAKNIIHSPMKIVFSRHPYDIAGMSTNRDWTSCMSLPNGSNAGYIKRDIKFGAIVAYLIKADDKNIRKPLGRIRLIPMGLKSEIPPFRFNQDEDDGPMILRPEYACYTAPDLNNDIIDDFINEVYYLIKILYNDKRPAGTYVRNKSLYNDGMTTEIEKK